MFFLGYEFELSWCDSYNFLILICQFRKVDNLTDHPILFIFEGGDEVGLRDGLEVD